MWDNNFDYLTGTVHIRRIAPIEWKNKCVLPFWINPNNPKWGDYLCRVLYHESSHFWQFLISTYLVSLIDELWEKFLHFENTGEINLDNNLMKNYFHTNNNEMFSPKELVECWARFWDVHTRGPHRIIEDDNISFSGVEYKMYSSNIYDSAMLNGPHSNLYKRPFKWLLQKVSNNSLLAQLIFPFITNAAFTTLDPVNFFCKITDFIINSGKIRDFIDKFRSAPINSTWIACWGFLFNEVFVPFIQTLDSNDNKLIPYEKIGLDIIHDGKLKTHPIYNLYLKKCTRGNFRMWFTQYKAIPYSNKEYDIIYAQIINQLSKKNPFFAPFIMPGQPFYRSTLGTLIPPPKIQFENYSWFAPQILEVPLYEGLDFRAEDGKTFEFESESLELRINQYYSAIEAVSLGLDPNAFRN